MQYLILVGLNMKVLIAPDKFKGALTAPEVANAIQIGVKRALPDAETLVFSMADGGEGTLDLLLKQTRGVRKKVRVPDPLMREVIATYGLLEPEGTAYIEMAQASGLLLLAPKEQNPLHTSTLGTGLLIRHAIEAGAKRLVVGIGGSATCDGGMGVAVALGWEFRDKSGNLLAPSGAALPHIAQVSAVNVPPTLRIIDMVVACDVSNPLFGKNGAAQEYAPQKGASPEAVIQLDSGLRNLANRLVQFGFGSDKTAFLPGSGAAGGLGFGLQVFCGARLQSGTELLMQHSGITGHFSHIDLLITGEGKLDTQSATGKVVGRLAEEAQKHGVPAIALCGTLALLPEETQALGLTYAASVLSHPMQLEEALNQTAKLLTEHTTHLIQLFNAAKYGR
ncbi:MAG TPA: glycerate kinase [Rhodothermales bacterium]|nr:glycerate kinase [Rhodothermales bacterium]